MQLPLEMVIIRHAVQKQPVFEDEEDEDTPPETDDDQDDKDFGPIERPPRRAAANIATQQLKVSFSSDYLSARSKVNVDLQGIITFSGSGINESLQVSFGVAQPRV